MVRLTLSIVRSIAVLGLVAVAGPAASEGATCEEPGEVTHLRVEVLADGSLALDWDALDDACLADRGAYRVFSASTPVPTTWPGAFPDDPSFTMVGTSSSPRWVHAPVQGDEYFLVTAVGTGGGEGPPGHYRYECPCFDAEEIDRNSESLVNLDCRDLLPSSLELRGSRGPDPGNDPQAPNAWVARVGPGNECEFHDLTVGTDRRIRDLTMEQAASCRNSLLASRMSLLNFCPPGDEIAASGVSLPGTDFLVSPGESLAAAVLLGSLGGAPLRVQMTEHADEPWFAASPADVVIPGGDFRDGFLVVDAAGLDPGSYRTTLRVATNDPLSPLLEREVTLTVVGPPDIDVDPSLLDFGTVTVHSSRTKTVHVTNHGDLTLVVEFVSTSSHPFLVISPGFTVPAGGSYPLGVSFSPEDVGSFEGTLRLISNDPDEPETLVPLVGIGTAAE